MGWLPEKDALRDRGRRETTAFCDLLRNSATGSPKAAVRTADLECRADTHAGGRGGGLDPIPDRTGCQANTIAAHTVGDPVSSHRTPASTLFTR